MNTVLWVLQVVLAVAFLAAGAMKATKPKSELAGQMGWVDDFSANGVKAIGVLEVLAAVGLVLPWALDVAPVLTPLAALGLVLMMVGAAVVHARRGEAQMIAVNVVLGVLAAVVAVGRF